MMDWSAHFLCFLAGAMFMLLAQIFGKTIWNVLLLCVRAIHKESIPNRLPKADGHRLSPINRKTARATPLSNNASRYFDDVVQLRQGSVSIEKQQNNDVSLTIVRDRNGDICGEEHLVCNIPHRNDGPARWIKDGLGLTQEYWVDGKKHRQDDPAVIIKMVDGSERLEYWIDGNMVDYTETCRFLKIGGLIRDNCKVFSGRETSIDKNGAAKEEYYADGKLHRKNGPARIVTTSDGSVWEEYWQHGNLLSVERRPANIKNCGNA